MSIKSIQLGILSIILCIGIYYIPIGSQIYLNFFSILSIIPIYIITRKNPSIGLISYLVSFLSIGIINSYDNSMIFLLFHGLLGIFLGLFSHYRKNHIITSLITGGILYISINGYNYINTSYNMCNFNERYILTQLIILIFSIFFSLLTLSICEYVYNKIIKINFISNLIK